MPALGDFAQAMIMMKTAQFCSHDVVYIETDIHKEGK